MTKQGTTLHITLDQSTLELMATGSLTGMVVDKMNSNGNGYVLPEHLILCFPQTTLAWRRDHGGPDSIVVPEYTLPCFLDCLLKLQIQGVKISVSTYDTNP